MESTTPLDYVLFKLTPTRTRCDLIIFAGKSNEKLAYGLLDPFLSHLRSAKDQISKGGYSITLRPPSSSSVVPHWFTKGTVLRFVRFVSTPEVLERFQTIEREISQLENSISNAAAAAEGGLSTDNEGNGNVLAGYSKDSANSYSVQRSSKDESNEGSDHTQEENSKVRLQRVLETRKAVLRKEQAMVYARALAAGFEMDNLHDLLSFSDAFGASRLREACINFKDLCKKKNEDRVWVDEIAAMRAMVQPELAYIGTSGIILAGEENDPSAAGKQNGGTDMPLSDSMTNNGSSDVNPDAQNPSADSKAQMANPWAQNFVPYLRNFHGPIYQQMPPYQGYGYTGMQVPPPYYPANMSWPSDLNGAADHDSHDHRNRRSSSKKRGKSSNARGSEKEDPDEHTGSSGSSSETVSSTEKSVKKKHGKKSSRKVVIRNINYITSKRDGDKDGSSEADSSDEEYLNGGSLKQQLEEAVGSFEKHKNSSSRHKKRNGSKHLASADAGEDADGASVKNNNGNKDGENWDALQQLLLREDSDPEPHSMSVDEKYFVTERSNDGNSSAFKPESEVRTKHKPIALDAFLVTEKDEGDDGKRSSVQGFDPCESTRPIINKGGISEEFLLSHRNEKSEGYTHMTLSDDAARSSMIRSQSSDDWIVGNQSYGATNQGGNNHLVFVEGDYVQSSADQFEQKAKDVIIDDSLMIQGHLTDDHPQSQLTTDIGLVSDIVEATLIENGTVSKQKSESVGFYEPDELYMVRDREAVVEQTLPSWNPELDIAVFSSVNESSKKPYVDACEESKLANSEKNSSKKTVKTPSRDPRSRTLSGPARRAKPEPTPGTRRSTFGNKTTTPKSQLEKKQEEERRKRMEELLIQRQKRIAQRSSGGGNEVNSRKPQTGSKAATPSPDKAKPKPVLRSSTIDRLAAAKTYPKPASTQPKKESPKVKSGNANSGLQKTNTADSKKMSADLSKPPEKKSGIANMKGISSPISDLRDLDDQKDIKELHVTSSITNEDVKVVAQMEISDEKVDKPLDNHPTTLDSIREKYDIISKEFASFQNEGKVSDDHLKSGPELSVHPLPESPPKPLDSALIVEENAGKTVTSPGFTEISEIEESTPAPTKETGVDSIQMRRKWDGAENSPKAAKGFRKLLMFGRKN